jgi:hypothetical protein
VGSHDDQRRELEAELQRVLRGAGHIRLAQDPTMRWPEEEVRRVLSILRPLGDGAGEETVFRALGITPDQMWRRDDPS